MSRDPVAPPPEVQEVLDARDSILEPCQPRRYSKLAQLAANPENHFVVAFGGGSVPGLVGNCALARILEEIDLLDEVREVWGTSAGAVVGGCWSSGAPADDILRSAHALDRDGSVDFSKGELVKRLLPMVFRRSKRSLEGLPDGLVKGTAFRDQIKTTLRVENFEECRLPFFCIACTDDGHARKVVFRKGPLLNAITASMCIPGIAVPVPAWNGEDHGYFDGGVVEKTPLISVLEHHRREARKERLLVLCTHFDNEARITRPRGFLNRFVSTMHRMEDTIWQYQVEEVRAAEDVKFVVLNPHMTQGGMFDFSAAEINYLWARREFKEQLSNARIGMRFGAN